MPLVIPPEVTRSPSSTTRSPRRTSGKLIPVLMVSGRRALADETGVAEPHRAGADRGQLATLSMMSARERAHGTRGSFPARVA